MDYPEAQALLGKRDRKKLRYANYLHRREEGAIAIRQHNTDILTFYPDGRTLVDTAGWHTVTTRARLNDYLPHGWRVYQDRRVMYFWNPTTQEKLLFADGAEIDAEGHISGCADLSQVEAQQKTRKRISKFVKRYMEAFKAGKVKAPGLGDCLFCQFRKAGSTLPGEFQPTMGEISGDKDHLNSHMEESYFVPSLLLRACEVADKRGGILSQAAKWTIGGWLRGEDLPNFGCYEQLSKALKLFMEQQLGCGDSPAQPV